MARYQEIADDLRRRLSSGEFGEVGDRIPTLTELMAEYGVAGVQTMRTAQAVLVNEGVLRTRHGSGAYIVRVPSTAAVDLVSIGHALKNLERELAAVRQQVRDLGDRPELPEPSGSHSGRSWAWASWIHCKTCGAGGSGITRGWVDTNEDF